MKTSHWLLAGALCVFVLSWLTYPQYVSASDPFGYSSASHHLMSTGRPLNGHIFSQRLGLVGPLALSYWLFGVGNWSTHLLPLLAALGIFVSLWVSLRGTPGRVLSCTLAAVSIPLFRASIQLYPDVLVSAFMFASACCVFRRDTSMKPSALTLKGIAGALLLVLAFSVKLSAWWVLPLWLFALIADLRGAQRSLLLRHFYVPAFLTALLFTAAYLFLCDKLWGDVWSRIHSVNSVSTQHAWSLSSAQLRSWVYRLTLAPVALLVRNCDIWLLPLAAFGAWHAEGFVARTRIYVVCCSLGYWFGSISVSSYEPMPLVFRMMFPLLPGLYVLAGSGAHRLIRHFRYAGAAQAVGLGVAGLYLLTLRTQAPVAQELEGEAMSVVRSAASRFPEDSILLVTADERSRRSLIYYFGYLYPDNLRVVSASDLRMHHLQARQQYVFIDRQRSAYLARTYGHRSFESDLSALPMEPLVLGQQIALWKVPEPSVLAPLISND